MKKLVLTMASLVMLVSMAFAQNETPMLPESHGMTDNQPAWGSSQDFTLNGAWTWWSTYLTAELTDLENALGTNGSFIKAMEQFVQNSSLGWSGTLSTISNDKMYFIGLAEGVSDYSFRLRGARANADDVLITVAANDWNWIGYPVAAEMTVADALVNYTPSNNETFKAQNGFVTYNEANSQWFGNLSTLEPGQGYMLKSEKSTDVTFTYPATPSSKKTIVSSVESHNATEWQPVMANNPTNMNMIAVVNLDNEELRSDNVEIGVFNGETCRGAVRPMYVEPLDQYVVFLTMYGEENEPFTFRMLDNGTVYESNEASVSYNADAVIGRIDSPFQLNFNTKPGFAGNLNLFPNPVNRGEMVNLTLPAEGTVEVINVLGSTMKRVRMAEGSQLAADMAPGIYTIKVTDAEGNVYVDKLIVK
jgi:hypothetical protein